MIGGTVETDDIVARLRGEHYKFVAVPKENKLEISPKSVNRLGSLWLEAADKIERLRAENATLRKKLDQFVGDFKDEVQREAL